MVKLTDLPTFHGDNALEYTPNTRSSNVSYDRSHFSSLFPAEDGHFWFQARNHIIATLVKQLDTEYQSGYRFLEIGCGNGNVLRELEHVCSNGNVMGMDLFAEGLRFARQRVTAPLVQADIFALPFKTKFEMIGLFDVLEHLQDDTHILSHLHTLLPAGGAVLITVPAYMSLWSYADRLANHKRRYTKRTLSDKLSENGFQVSYITYFMMSILPMVWFRRKIANYMIAHSDNPNTVEHKLFQNELKIRPLINDALTFLLDQESYFIRSRRQIPFGTSLLAVAHKI
jgi:SAM-dependent methyltransferase